MARSGFDRYSIDREPRFPGPLLWGGIWQPVSREPFRQHSPLTPRAVLEDNHAGATMLGSDPWHGDPQLLSCWQCWQSTSHFTRGQYMEPKIDRCRCQPFRSPCDVSLRYEAKSPKRTTIKNLLSKEHLVPTVPRHAAIPDRLVRAAPEFQG